MERGNPLDRQAKDYQLAHFNDVYDYLYLTFNAVIIVKPILATEITYVPLVAINGQFSVPLQEEYKEYTTAFRVGVEHLLNTLHERIQEYPE